MKLRIPPKASKGEFTPPDDDLPDVDKNSVVPPLDDPPFE